MIQLNSGSELNTNRSSINNILEISTKVKCNYPDTSISQQPTALNYSNLEQLENAISNSNNLMDCSSVLRNILLQHYLDSSVFNSNITINRLEKYKDEWNLMFIRENLNLQIDGNHQEKLLYLEYKPFYYLKDYLDKNVIQLSTNNMGWWLLGLGKTHDVITNINENIKNMWYGEYQDVNKECYLAFLGDNKTSHNNGMIICHLDTIYNILVTDAKKDWNKMIDNIPDSNYQQCIDNIMKISLLKNNSTMETVHLHYMNSLFLEKENGINNLFSILENLGNNLANGFIPNNIDITPQNN